MLVFFFNDTATTEIYTLSLHDALPISHVVLEAGEGGGEHHVLARQHARVIAVAVRDLLDFGALRILRSESTRLNSSHANISYAVFCLKKKTRRTQSRQR